MEGKKLCPKCMVSKRISKLHEWRDNGTIVERKQCAHRMIFIENDNLKGILANVAKILDVPIERIIIESQRKSTYDYVENMLPSIVVKLSRFLMPLVVRNLVSLAQTMGYGRIEDVTYRFKKDADDYITMIVKDSYYPPSQTGTLAGAMEVTTGHQVTSSYKKIDEERCKMTAIASEHPKELSDRLAMRVYPNKEGDIGFVRCAVCGLPIAISGYQWKVESGSIESRTDGRRMVMVGASEYEALFDELEKELGEDITRVIIEAERRYVKTGAYSLEATEDEDTFREQLGVRGLGNLKESVWGGESLHLLIENACLHMLVVGMAQGFFELTSGLEAAVEWSLARDGDLTIKVSAKH